MTVAEVYSLEQLFQTESEFCSRYGLDVGCLDAFNDLRRKLVLPDDDIVTKLACWVVAPTLACFARWIHSQARKGKLHLVAMMREGRLPCEIVKQAYGHDFSVVWLNRSIAMLAAFGAGDDEALLNWLVRTRTTPITISCAWEMLLGEGYVHGDAERPIDLVLGQELIEMWRTNRAIDSMRARARRLADQVVMHWDSVCQRVPTDRYALVDFACAGNIQRSLKTVFWANEREVSFTGLNFLTTAGTRWAREKGSDIRGFLASDGSPLWLAQAYARTPELIELFCAAPVGSLEGYDDYRPVFGKGLLDEGRVSLVSRVQGHIIEAAKYYIANMPEVLTSCLGQSLWGRLLLEPLAVEALSLAAWPLDAGLEMGKGRHLAPSLTGISEPWDKFQTAWPAASRVLSGII